MEKIMSFLKNLFDRKIVILAAAGTLLFIGMAIFAPLLAPYDPNRQDLMSSLAKPSAKYLLGTDLHGRDILSRIIFGTRISMVIGILAVFIGTIIGSLLGLIAGYFGGIPDLVIMRILEAVFSIPRIILAIALGAVYGNGLAILAVIIGFSTIPGYARLIRGQVFQVKQNDFIAAGEVIGVSSVRQILKHILPNVISPIIVMMTQNIGSAILTEASLSFLGVGINPPTATWGGMVNDGRSYLLTSPLASLAPGVCIVILVICLNILGDGVRDALDPRLKGITH
ncbi:MAG: ABC transporter permease [Lachnospiraceae bacterium]|nr:ABC transporter permease [Lachnospiraceae bacterium]